MFLHSWQIVTASVESLPKHSLNESTSVRSDKDGHDSRFANTYAPSTYGVCDLDSVYLGYCFCSEQGRTQKHYSATTHFVEVYLCRGWRSLVSAASDVQACKPE